MKTKQMLILTTVVVLAVLSSVATPIAHGQAVYRQRSRYRDGPTGERLQIQSDGYQPRKARPTRRTTNADGNIPSPLDSGRVYRSR